MGANPVTSWHCHPEPEKIAVWTVSYFAVADILASPSDVWMAAMELCAYDFGDTRTRYEALIGNWGGSIIMVEIEGVEIEFGVINEPWVAEFIVYRDSAEFYSAFAPPDCQTMLGYGFPAPPA